MLLTPSPCHKLSHLLGLPILLEREYFILYGRHLLGPCETNSYCPFWDRTVTIQLLLISDWSRENNQQLQEQMDFASSKIMTHMNTQAICQESSNKCKVLKFPCGLFLELCIVAGQLFFHARSRTSEKFDCIFYTMWV